MIQPVQKAKVVVSWFRQLIERKNRSNRHKLTRKVESKKMGYFANLYLKILKNNMVRIW